MKHALIGILLFFALTSCSESRVESEAYNSMLTFLLSHSVNEVALHEINQIDTPIFLDARSIQEFKVSHIENARFIGYDSLHISTLNNIEKDQRIVVYCSVGYRSEKVAEKLIELGYKNVSNLYGGIFEWMNQHKPVVDTMNEETNRIHAYDETWGIWLTQGEKVY